MPKVSIIVPVYNVKGYLCNCVDSILAQTFDDFELILVDDGSTDGSGAICDEYAVKDARVCVIHKENGGAGTARNTGLDVAGGEYICFVDSDDYIRPMMLQELMDALLTTGVNISICDYELFTSVAELKPECESPIKVRLQSSAQFYQERILLGTVPWAKLYRRACFESIRYPAIRYGEDEYVTYRVLLNDATVAVVDAKRYCYYVNDAGMVRSTWSEKRLEAEAAFGERITYFKQRGMDELRRQHTRGYLHWILSQMHETKLRPELKQAHNRLAKTGKKLLRQCLKEGTVAGDEDMWMCAMLYPRLTKCYCTCVALIGKLGLRRGKEK